MVGGTSGIVGLWLGIVLDNRGILMVATAMAMCLHLPSVYWQLRQVHGQREIILPAYATAWAEH